jgi:AcrR family transcriptional regulator
VGLNPSRPPPFHRFGPSPREQILEAALHLFSRKGYHAVSLRELAGRVGLHNSTLLHHFQSKSELGRRVFEAVAQRQLELWEPLARDDPPQLDTLIRVLRDAAAHFLDAPEEARLLLRTLTGETGPAEREEAADPKHPVERMRGLLRDWLLRAGRSGAIRQLDIDEAERSLLALLLFDSTAPDPSGGPERDSDQRRRVRRVEELEGFVRAALVPGSGRG